VVGFGKPLLKQSSLDCVGIVRKNTWAGSCGGSRRFHGDRMKTRASKELEAISLVKRGFQKAWGLSPPSSPNLLSLVTPITSGAHSRRCAFSVHFVLPNRRRVTYSTLYVWGSRSTLYLSVENYSSEQKSLLMCVQLVELAL
jgi:hypothetical protein